LITHAVIGVAAATAVAHGPMSARFWALSVCCAVIPDADVLAFAFGIPYSHTFGHRGFFHSLSFALLLGLVVAALFFRQDRAFSPEWWLLVGYFFAVTATHGILDCFTNGGLGIALLSPFDNTRYFFDVTPIQVSPLSLRGFISERGIRVLVSELWWVWAPALLLAFGTRWLVRPVWFPRV